LFQPICAALAEVRCSRLIAVDNNCSQFKGGKSCVLSLFRFCCYRDREATRNKIHIGVRHLDKTCQVGGVPLRYGGPQSIIESKKYLTIARNKSLIIYFFIMLTICLLPIFSRKIRISHQTLDCTSGTYSKKFCPFGHFSMMTRGQPLVPGTTSTGGSIAIG
jgi:hypothetical protein